MHMYMHMYSYGDRPRAAAQSDPFDLDIPGPSTGRRVCPTIPDGGELRIYRFRVMDCSKLVGSPLGDLARELAPPPERVRRVGPPKGRTGG